MTYKKEKAMKKIILVLTLFFLVPATAWAYNGLVHSASEGLTGTGGDSLDEISCTDSDGRGHDLATGDVAIATDPTTDLIYFYTFDISLNDSESSPSIIVPNNRSSCSTPNYGEWVLSSVYGASGGGLTWVAKATTYTAVNGDGILADTSGGAWTLTLPASPSVGDTVGIIDSTGSFDTYNLTIDRNGSLIMSTAENLVANVNEAAFTLVYSGATDGWKLDTYPIGGDMIGSNNLSEITNAATARSNLGICPGETEKTSTSEYTIGTTDSCESYGGQITTTTAAHDLNLPEAAATMHFCVVTNSAHTISLAPNQAATADTITLDGTAYTAGNEVDSGGTAGEVICCSYYSANNWNCSSDGWSDGGAND